jgi:parallel beta-helix repeat protein
MKNKNLIAVLLITLPASACFSRAAPQIIWASDPIRPGETLVVMGEGFSGNSVVEMNDPSTPDLWVALKLLQVSGQSLKAVVPDNRPLNVWACRVREGECLSTNEGLNEPVVWWWNGDGGEFATPGGWLRVFGKSLSFGGQSRAQLRAADGTSIELLPRESSCYALAFALPAEIAPGDYALSVHNGLRAEAARQSGGVVAVRQRTGWKADLFNVKDFGPKPAEALVAALRAAETNGGGVVYLPRGRYAVKDALKIPTNTVLRGESMALTSLYWPDFEKPPSELITGADFGVESLSLYCQNHRNVVADTAVSKRMFLRQVRIRANAFFMIEDVGKEFRGRKGPASHKACGAAVLLRGTNFEITGCDLYASNYGVRILKAKTGLIARNQIRYGGRGYSMENTERLIFEENLVEGNNLLAIGNDITTFWSNYCRHIYFANNRIQQMFGADREMMTLDAASGAYFGSVAAVDGMKVTLSADPVFKDYAPKPHTNWVGAAVQILDGTGAGQYRFVVAHTGREWQIDHPWTVLPDQTSRISIAPFRGQNLFIGNTFEDGGAFQLYAAAHDSIVAENKGSRMDGFLVWGLNPHGWGYQPSWYCQFIGNEILEGNGYGHRSASLGTVGYDENKAFDGALVRGAVFRRNVLNNNASISIAGLTEDTLVENNSVKNSDKGIFVKASARGTLLRGNTFEGVTQTVQEEPPQKPINQKESAHE